MLYCQVVFHSLRPHGLHAPCQNPLSSTISWSLLKFMSIELVILSNHLILCHSFFFLPSIFPGIRIFSSESVLHIRWSKYWSFNFSQQSFQWIIRVDFLKDGLVWAPCSPKDSQESYPTPQFKSINSSALSLIYGPTLTSVHDYWKNYSFDNIDLYWQMMSLLFNTLSRFVIDFLSKSKCQFHGCSHCPQWFWSQRN